MQLTGPHKSEAGWLLCRAGPWLALFDKILDYLEVPHSIQVGAQPQTICQPLAPSALDFLTGSLPLRMLGCRSYSCNGAGSGKTLHCAIHPLQLGQNTSPYAPPQCFSPKAQRCVAISRGLSRGGAAQAGGRAARTRTA